VEEKSNSLTPQQKPAHPTKVALLDCVVELLDTRQPNEISVELVCGTSGISLGSVYHHYRDLPDLIDSAMVFRFARYIDTSIGWLNEALDGATNKDEFFEGLKRVTRGTQTRQMKGARIERAGILHRAGFNQAFAAKLGFEQQRLTDEITNFIAKAQERGWVVRDIDPRAGAVLIQSYTLGRIVDDFTENTMNDELWVALIDRLAAQVFEA